MLSCRCFENSSVYSGGPKRRINWSKLAKTKQIFALSVNINVLLELCVVVYLSLYRHIIDQTYDSEINMETGPWISCGYSGMSW